MRRYALTVSGEASNENPFHLEPGRPGFEALSKTNGFRFWWASELAAVLGYESLNGFRKAIDARTSCERYRSTAPADSSCLLCDNPRFWGYSRDVAGSGVFSPSRLGPSSTIVRDGDVEAWRWGH